MYMFTTRPRWRDPLVVTANIIWVMSSGLRDEHVHQFEVFATLKYVVIKPQILGSIARQPVLSWQAVYIPIVVDGLWCFHSNTSNDVVPCKEVPFGCPVESILYLDPYISKKLPFWGPIFTGHFLRPKTTLTWGCSRIKVPLINIVAP